MAVPYQRRHQQKKLKQNQNQLSQSSHNLDILKAKPFWIFDKQEHLKLAIETNQQCCFNHIVGLPVKDGREFPLFDYEKLLYDTLMNSSADSANDFKDKHLWIKKATGLGISEFMLRFMAWLCVKDNSYRNSQMCIVTGSKSGYCNQVHQKIKGNI